MLNVYNKEYKSNSALFLRYYRQTGLNEPKNFSKIKHLIFLDEDVSFEEIVLVLSDLEDNFNCELKSINIRCSINKKIFFELLDFYNSYDLQINIIADDILTPFKIIHDIFTTNYINSYHNYGLCINLDNINHDIWFNKSVLQTIEQYINTGFNINNFYLK
jgi:hypothetical protein